MLKASFLLMKNLNKTESNFLSVLFFIVFIYLTIRLFFGGGRVVRRCCVSYITGASN